LLRLQDDDSSSRQFSFFLPAGWRHLRVQTTDLGLAVPFTVEPRDDHHVVTIPSLPGEQGPWDLTVSFSQATPAPLASAEARPESTSTRLAEVPALPATVIPLPFLLLLFPISD
jgi:hypothetical protein